MRDVFLFSKVMTWTPGVGGSLARTIVFLDASSVHCWADAMRLIAIELPPEDEVKDKDLVREVSRSLYVTAHNWEKVWQNVIIEMNLENDVWSSSDMKFCERIHRIRRDDCLRWRTDAVGVHGVSAWRDDDSQEASSS